MNKNYLNAPCYIIINNINGIGGTERATINLANMLVSLGRNVYIVSLLTRESNLYYKHDPIVNIIHVCLPKVPSNPLNKLWWNISAYNALKEIVKEKTFAIGTGHAINVLLSFLPQQRNIIIGCEHIQKETIPWLSRLIMRFRLPKLNALVVLSNSAKEKYTLYNKRIVVIPNIIPFLPSQHSAFTLHRNLIMVGRVDKNKGYDRAIPIFEYIKEKHPDWNVNIYGDGDQRDSIELQIRTKGLSNVILHHATKQIDEKYKESDILLMTSHSEAMPMIILEANAFGIPVVAYENEGTNALIQDGKTGYVVSDGDESAFCKCVEKLICDTELYRVFSKSAYDYSLLFSAAAISKKWKVLFEDL